MAPEAGERPASSCFRLRNLILVMRKDEIDAPTMNVERFAKQIDCHRRALEVPARTTTSPR